MSSVIWISAVLIASAINPSYTKIVPPIDPPLFFFIVFIIFIVMDTFYWRKK